MRRGEYVVGWAKRGSGVIGTNKKDANDTVEQLLADLAAGQLLPTPSRSAMRRSRPSTFASASQQLVDYEGWVRIDRHEQDLANPTGAPRRSSRLEHLLDAVEGRR